MNRLWHIAFNALLAIVIVVCYILILVLFCSAKSLNIPSFTHPNIDGIKPTAAVTLLAAILAAAKSALTTRAVEHNLWFKLAPRTVKKRLTVVESYLLAQWSVSRLERLFYLFRGESWALKVVGPE